MKRGVEREGKWSEGTEEFKKRGLKNRTSQKVWQKEYKNGRDEREWLCYEMIVATIVSISKGNSWTMFFLIFLLF